MLKANIDKPNVNVLYLDLDGTVRHGKDELGRFVNTVDDVQVFDDVPEILLAYKQMDWRIVGCSNQGGIALGYMDVSVCVSTMIETQNQVFGAFDRITFCPHHPDAEDPTMARCWCRKPKPGMIIASATEMSIEFGEVYPPSMALFVGDRPEDYDCAKAAGIEFMEASEWRRRTHLHRLHEQKQR